jgi:hypothetical protein
MSKKNGAGRTADEQRGERGRGQNARMARDVAFSNEHSAISELKRKDSELNGLDGELNRKDAKIAKKNAKRKKE